MTTPGGTTTGSGPGGAGDGPAATRPSASGPHGSLARWMEAHAAELRTHLRRMLERPDDAEDVLQEVWVTAHRSPPDDGPDANVRAWLYRVATHAALDRLATERRRARLLDAHAHGLSDGSSPAPDEGLAEADREEIRRRVSALPRKQREAVWLRWIEGEPYEAVARQLGGSPAAARANVYQGLKKLRCDLSPFWNEETHP